MEINSPWIVEEVPGWNSWLLEVFGGIRQRLIEKKNHLYKCFEKLPIKLVKILKQHRKKNKQVPLKYNKEL